MTNVGERFLVTVVIHVHVCLDEQMVRAELDSDMGLSRTKLKCNLDYVLQILENAEINNLIKIVGLQYNKKYSSEDDLKSLRYGHVMIMTDQDQDGSHIKGLLINFIHSNWPSLTRLPFLEEFITPIVKVSNIRG